MMQRLDKRRIPWLITIAVVVVAMAGGGWYVANHDWHRRTVDVRGTKRTYLWYPPANNTRELRPLVLAYHGHSGPAERMRRSSLLHEMVDTHGFYLAYIQADPSWHFFERGDWGGNPDVLMFDELTTKLIADHRIDPNRVYLVGISRGGDFVVHLATRRSTKIAAVLAQGSCLLDEYVAERPLAMMFIVGTRDGEVRPDKVENYPDIYRDRGHEVEVLRPKDVPHRWEVSLNDEAWEFLSKHSLKEEAELN